MVILRTSMFAVIELNFNLSKARHKNKQVKKLEEVHFLRISFSYVQQGIFCIK